MTASALPAVRLDEPDHRLPVAYGPPSGSELEAFTRLAVQIADTEFVPSSLRGRAPAVLAAILTGRELGVGPMTALQKVYVTSDGKISQAAELMRALIQKAGHTVRATVYSNTECTLVGIRSDDPDYPVTVTWTMEDAARAGLAGKGPWSKYPRAMLLARATSELARLAFGDVLAGISYTPDEIGAAQVTDVADDGSLVYDGPTPVDPLEHRRDLSRRWRKAMHVAVAGAPTQARQVIASLELALTGRTVNDPTTVAAFGDGPLDVLETAVAAAEKLRAVLEDDGRCGWESEAGRRCGREPHDGADHLPGDNGDGSATSTPIGEQAQTAEAATDAYGVGASARDGDVTTATAGDGQPEPAPHDVSGATVPPAADGAPPAPVPPPVDPSEAGRDGPDAPRTPSSPASEAPAEESAFDDRLARVAALMGRDGLTPDQMVEHLVALGADPAEAAEIVADALAQGPSRKAWAAASQEGPERAAQADRDGPEAVAPTLDLPPADNAPPEPSQPVAPADPDDPDGTDWRTYQAVMASDARSEVGRVSVEEVVRRCADGEWQATVTLAVELAADKPRRTLIPRLTALTTSGQAALARRLAERWAQAEGRQVSAVDTLDARPDTLAGALASRAELSRRLARGLLALRTADPEAATEASATLAAIGTTATADLPALAAVVDDIETALSAAGGPT